MPVKNSAALTAFFLSLLLVALLSASALVTQLILK